MSEGVTLNGMFAVLLFVIFVNTFVFVQTQAILSSVFRVGWCLGWSTVVSASVVACNFLVNGEISRFPYVSRKRRDA
jgi:hypothetical protein